MAITIKDAAEASKALAHYFSRAHHAVFFGGAGVSTASGIPDFRSTDGLYHQKFSYPPETMLSHSFYETHTIEFFDFYRTRMISPDARPNQAHIKLAELEAQGHLAAVVTQNIDGLHQDAGSRCVYELHGSVRRNICQQCGRTYSAEWILASKDVPHCSDCGAQVKPDVVLYEEALNARVLEKAAQCIARADLLVVGGTSLVVYPAAGLLRYFAGDTLIVCNLSPTPQDSAADVICACDIVRAFDF